MPPPPSSLTVLLSQYHAALRASARPLSTADLLDLAVRADRGGMPGLAAQARRVALRHEKQRAEALEAGFAALEVRS